MAEVSAQTSVKPAGPVATARSGETEARSKPWLDAWVKRHKTRTVRPMVQGELSMDTVRVVRNDLSEADLEIVPAKPAEPFIAAVEQPVKVASESKTTLFKQYVSRLVSAVRSII